MKYLLGRDSYRRPSSRGQHQKLALAFLVQITSPAFALALTFAFTFQSHRKHFRLLYPLAVCHTQRALILLVSILIDYPSQHTSTTVTMVSHCHVCEKKQPTNTIAQPDSAYLSNTQTVRISQKKHSNVLFESVADHYHSSRNT